MRLDEFIDELHAAGWDSTGDGQHEGITHLWKVIFKNQKAPVVNFQCSGGLSSLMDNVLASTLGGIAREAGSPKRTDVGDSIDRGLILRRLLEENGFILIHKGR